MRSHRNVTAGDWRSTLLLAAGSFLTRDLTGTTYDCHDYLSLSFMALTFLKHGLPSPLFLIEHSSFGVCLIFNPVFSKHFFTDSFTDSYLLASL